MLLPLGFETLHGKSRKQFPATAEIVIERADEERFSETARAGEKIDLAVIGQLVDQRGLVNVNRIHFPDFGKCLYAYGKLSCHTGNIHKGECCGNRVCSVRQARAAALIMT